MLAGRPSSSFTRLTAFIASPNDAPGARLNDKVTTGNWPWWLMVMGTFCNSRCENAPNGTWFPFGNTAAAGDGPLKTALDAVAAEPVTILVAAFAPVLVGPRER